MQPIKQQPLLKIEDLSVAFQTYEGIVHAVNDVSFDLYDGESIAMVGESGCGKSATMFALMGLHNKSITRITAQTMQFEQRDLLHLGEREMNQVRGKDIAMVFQDPMTSFNPVRTNRYQTT